MEAKVEAAGEAVCVYVVQYELRDADGVTVSVKSVHATEAGALEKLRSDLEYLRDALDAVERYECAGQFTVETPDGDVISERVYKRVVRD